MPATQTGCAIPKEAMAAAEGGILRLVAHGPEVNFFYPPRPAEPEIPWVQDWTVKAWFVSRTGGIAGMEMVRRERSSDARGGSTSGKPKCPTATDPTSMIGSAMGGAMGMLRKKTKPADCE